VLGVYSRALAQPIVIGAVYVLDAPKSLVPLLRRKKLAGCLEVAFGDQDLCWSCDRVATAIRPDCAGNVSLAVRARDPIYAQQAAHDFGLHLVGHHSQSDGSHKQPYNARDSFPLGRWDSVFARRYPSSDDRRCPDQDCARNRSAQHRRRTPLRLPSAALRSREPAAAMSFQRTLQATS